MFAFVRVFVLIAALASPSPATPSATAPSAPVPTPSAAEAEYFLGTWSCAGVPWTFSHAAAAPGWIQDVYGPPDRPGGSAYFGYVVGLGAWVYRDFHADGAYADLTATFAGGRWTFTGPYYPAGATKPLNGRITYVEVSPERYDRTFASLEGGAYVAHGGDTCTKTSP